MNQSKVVSDRDTYDIREDEEQGVKYQEIIDLLVAAGYFRARIKGLSPFDKVVGGMAWCMESCYVDVDVDVLFQENSSIGQKIAITEKIVKVLPRMGCSLRIEPHQIQGLDFIHIFPVIQWLVKQSVTVREERREFLRECAIRDFERRFRVDDNRSKILASFKKLQEEFKPKRILRRRGLPPDDEFENVESTLMEYGFSAISSIPEASQPYLQTIESEHKVGPKVINAIVSSQSEANAATRQQFIDIAVDIEARDTLSDHREALKEELREEEERNTALSARLEDTRASLRALQEDSEESNNNIGLFSKLRDLVLMEESLKQQEAEFKEHCRTELSRLQRLVQEASERSQNEGEDTESLCEAERSRVNTLRSQIAHRNRAAAQLQRRLDEVPGRAELAQYQRRFLELYSLVAQKHAETKQFYTMHNTLDDTRLYLAKELSLLNSVLDTYSQAMSNSLDKSSFIEQFESIVGAIKTNKAKVEARRNDEKMKKERLSQHLLDLVEQQRHYYTIVRQLKIEVKRNETLLAHLKAIKSVES